MVVQGSDLTSDVAGKAVLRCVWSWFRSRRHIEATNVSGGDVMTDVIDFLEKMGQDAQWRDASPGEVEQALTGAEIAPALQRAILARDKAQLEKLLGLVPLCAPYLPGNEDQGEGDEDEETPLREPDEKPEHSGRQAEISAA
jgi:hypothetical protein